MKVVQINATYGVGSTGNIVENINNYLVEKNIEAYAFWATAIRGDLVGKNGVYRIGTALDHKLHAVLRRIFKNQGFNSKLATTKLCKRLGVIKPDVVHLHNLHSNFINLPILLDFLAKEDIAVAVTLHDCWFFTGDCTYFDKMSCKQCLEDGCIQCPAYKSKFSKNKISALYNSKRKGFAEIKRLAVIGVSDWIADCSRRSLLSSANTIESIYNWIDTDTFCPQLDTQKTREKYSIEQNEKVILGVAQEWSREKGLEEFKILAKQLKGRAKIILVGNHKKKDKSENLQFIGHTANRKELAELYSIADVFVNPSRMETFGLVTAEALACGTPAVVYNNTGTAELIGDDCGILVEDGNTQKLIEAAQKILADKKEKYSANCIKRVKTLFNKTDLLSKHLDVYRKLVNDKVRCK